MQRGDLVVDHAADLGAALEQRLVAHVVVQIAVADVAEAEDRFARIGLRQRGARALDEFGHLRDGDRDVVLDVGELRLRHGFADRPKCLRFGLVLGHHGVCRQIGVERSLQQLVQCLARAAVVELHQHLPGAARQRIAHLPAMAEHGVDAGSRKQLEGRQAVAAALAQMAQQLDRALRVLHGNPGRRRGGRLRMQFQHRRRDDAERALGADEELLEVVAAIVLAQAAQAVPDTPVGQHGFEAEHLLAGIAVAQHIDAARVGRKIAADLAAAFGGQRRREQPVGFRGGALHVGEHAARLDRNGVVQRVELADAVQARKREHDLVLRARGHRAARQAGVAALRHDGDARFRAQAHHRRHFGGARRAHYAEGAAAVLPAPIGEVGRSVARGREHVAVADDRSERAAEAVFIHP